MKRVKPYKGMSRKSLEDALRLAEEKAEQEKNEWSKMEGFSVDSSLQKDKYNAAIGEVNEIKREIFARKTLVAKIGILLIAAMIPFALFLKKVSPSISDDGALHVDWWPGVDFRFYVYEDHVKAHYFNDKDVKVLEIPDTILGKPVTEIGNGFSNYLTQLEKVILGNNVERIGESAFNRNSTIKEIIGGMNVKFVGDGAFLGCSDLEYIEFGGNLEVIEDIAFADTSITSINTSDSLRYVGDMAFHGAKLEEMYIPDTLSEIGGEAFGNTPWLEKQIADEAGFVIVGDSVLLRYEGTESIVRIPDGVKLLAGFWDKSGCDTIVYIPDTVTSIEQYIFGTVEHQLTLYIPASVTSIAEIQEEEWFSNQLTFSREGDYEPNLHIITTENSTAHQYALDRGISFEIVEELPEY